MYPKVQEKLCCGLIMNLPDKSQLKYSRKAFVLERNLLEDGAREKKKKRMPWYRQSEEYSFT